MQISSLCCLAMGLMSFCFCALYAPFETIANPGIYVYGIDVPYNPVAPNDSIIRISANNVIFDLNGHTLSQAPGNTQAGLTGILVDPNLRFVTIKNGLINNLTGNGIQIGAGCFTVEVDFIITNSCDLRGFSLEGTSLNPIQELLMNQCSATSCCQGATGDYGLLLQNVIGFGLTNINISGNSITLTHGISGIRIENSTQGRMNNISTSGNFGTTPVKGFEFINVNSCLVDSCFSLSNLANAAAATCVGYDLLSTCSAVIFQNCTALTNVAVTAGSNVFGFRLDSNINDCSLENCRVINNSAANNVTGISCTSNQRNAISNTVVTRNSCIAGTAIGVLFSSCTGNKMYFSRINENTSQNGIARGIDIVSCLECVLQDCIVARNAGNGAANSFGIRITPASPTGEIMVTKTIALRNGATAANQLVGFAGTQMNANATEDVNTLQAWTNPGLT